MASNSFHGYSKFQDVKEGILRTYNQIVMARNIKDRHGIQVALNYLSLLTDCDRANIKYLFSCVSFEEAYHLALSGRYD